MSEGKCERIEPLHPPAYLPDADLIVNFRCEWSRAVSNWLDDAVNVQQRAFRKQGVTAMQEVQFFNFDEAAFPRQDPAAARSVERLP